MYYLVLKVPLAQYDTLLKKVDPASRVEELLKQASFEREDKKGHFERHMKILCKKEEALMLLQIAERLCSEIIPAISRDWANSE